MTIAMAIVPAGCSLLPWKKTVTAVTLPGRGTGPAAGSRDWSRCEPSGVGDSPGRDFIDFVSENTTMATYGGVEAIQGTDDKKRRSVLLAGLGAVSALLVVVAFAASHLSPMKVCVTGMEFKLWNYKFTTVDR
jgi:hypothetical protein